MKSMSNYVMMSEREQAQLIKLKQLCTRLKLHVNAESQRHVQYNLDTEPVHLVPHQAQAPVRSTNQQLRKLKQTGLNQVQEVASLARTQDEMDHATLTIVATKDVR